MRTVYIRDRGLIGLRLEDESGRYLKAPGMTVRAACGGSVSPGLRKVLGVNYGEPIEIVDERGKGL